MLEPGPRANASLCLHQDVNYSFPERCSDSSYTSSCSGLTLWHLYRTITCLLSFSLTRKVSEFWRFSPSALKGQLCWLKQRRQKAQCGTAGHICQTLLWQSSSAERGIKPFSSLHLRSDVQVLMSERAKSTDAAFTVRMNLARIRATFPRDSKWIVFMLSCSGGIRLICAICENVFIENIRYAGLAM